jgi:DNA repair exonuclease SbcCD ATPase subunit/DNA repair exonuclease SbcCD nuclease subunit
MKIAHLADIHIRLYKRHDEYRDVFKRLYTSLREHNVDRIALLGDIFHSKSILSPEAVDLASEFFRELSKIAPLDIIVGNHDVNIKNDQRMDAITPIVELVADISLKPATCRGEIYVYKESGMYLGIGNAVNYGIFSCLDEKNFPILKRPIDSSALPLVALFHGNLSGSFSETMYKFENTGYDADVLFKNYDMVMLGDIHRRQELRPHMWYAGSLIQQDFGESLEKGYLIWDTDTCEPAFIPIQNDYAFYNLKVNYKVTPTNLPVIQNCTTKASIRLTLEGFDYTIAEIKGIEIELKQLYNPISIEVKRDVKIVPRQGAQLTKIKTTSDVTIQNELIRKFLGSTPEDTILRVLEINKAIRQMVDEDDILAPSVWKILEAEWSGTFSYGPDNKLDFTKIKGLTGIFAPNRSGKSNFIDTLLYIFFNKSARVPRLSKIINNQLDECNGTAVLDVNGEFWRISRKSTRNLGGGTGTKVTLEKQINGVWQSEAGDSRTDTDKIIRRLIGNFEDLIVSSISPQGKIAYFLESGNEDTFRLELLSRFLGLNIFKLQYNFANQSTSELETLLKQHKQIDYASMMKSYRDEIDKLSESLVDYEEDKSYLSGQSEQLAIQIATLKAMIQEVVDNTQTSEYDREKLEKLIVQLRTQRNAEDQMQKDESARQEKLVAAELIAKRDSTDWKVKQWKKFQIDINKIDSDILVAKMGLKKDRSRVDILNQQPWNDTQYECQSCEFYKEATTLRKEIQEIENNVNRLQTSRASLVSLSIPLSNSEMELQKVEDQITEFNRLEQSIQLRKITVEKQDLQIDKIQHIITEQDQEFQKIQALKQVKESNAEVNVLVVTKEAEKVVSLKQMNLVEYNIAAHARRITELEEKVRQSENNLVKLEEMEQSVADYRLYLKCMHREGIPYTIMSSYIDIINQEIQKIVGDYIPFGINFALDNDKRTIPINLVYENGTVNPIELGSGMEKMIAAIAIRAALVSISNIPRCTLFVIDESFGQLDKDNIATVDKLLNHLKMMFENVLLISHVADVQDFVDQTITIDTSSGFSKINF